MKEQPDPGTLRLRAVLGIPLAISITTAVGLAAALLGGGWWHLLSWLLLAIPAAVIIVAMVKGSDASEDVPRA